MLIARRRWSLQKSGTLPGTEMNPSEAVRLYEIAVTRGEPLEQTEVDRIYSRDPDGSRR